MSVAQMFKDHRDEKEVQSDHYNEYFVVDLYCSLVNGNFFMMQLTSSRLGSRAAFELEKSQLFDGVRLSMKTIL